MQIFVKALSGSVHAVDVAETDSLVSLKETIQRLEGIPVDAQTLVSAGKLLESLEALEKASLVEVMLALDGGAKKRKKKVYTKPKKNKHKRKKVKLSILKYYKVDKKNNKITRLKKECPQPECGAGVFMAEHKNRHYCGKCQLTYTIENKGAAKGKK
uniref:Ubiquitin-like domain-containing protein n=1 Tax=Lotus japonicus TaxID=34305 RepID=I3SYC1_LOTJA|nr:unknown [Lotus japonicus]